MKKIWLTLLSLVVAVLFQVTNVKADGNQVSFTKAQDNNVEVKMTLPQATSVNALKVTIKVDGDQTTAPTFVYNKLLQDNSQVHEVRYDKKTKEVTLYLADLTAQDFSGGVTLGEFTKITTKIEFSNQTDVEIVDETKQLQSLKMIASSLVVEDQKTDAPTDNPSDEPTTDDQKPSDKPVTDDANKDESTGSNVDSNYQVNKGNNQDNPKKDGVLGQTGEHKAIILTGLGAVLVLTTGIVYLKFTR